MSPLRFGSYPLEFSVDSARSVFFVARWMFLIVIAAMSIMAEALNLR